MKFDPKGLNKVWARVLSPAWLARGLRLTTQRQSPSLQLAHFVFRFSVWFPILPINSKRKRDAMKLAPRQPGWFRLAFD
jgi:hypothetical protein